MSNAEAGLAGAQTEALRRVLAQPIHHSARADFLFLEAWERTPSDHAGVNMRVGQIRRANPGLAAAIRAELKAAALPGRVQPNGTPKIGQ